LRQKIDLLKVECSSEYDTKHIDIGKTSIEISKENNIKYSKIKAEEITKIKNKYINLEIYASKNDYDIKICKLMTEIESVKKEKEINRLEVIEMEKRNYEYKDNNDFNHEKRLYKSDLYKDDIIKILNDNNCNFEINEDTHKCNGCGAKILYYEFALTNLANSILNEYLDKISYIGPCRCDCFMFFHM
jgi:hypothetical protein